MKRWLSVLLIVLLAASLCACSAAKNEDLPIDTIVNENGTACTIDITTRGELQTDAEPVGSNVIVLEGESYSFPFTVSQLNDNGWSFEETRDAYGHQTDAGNEVVDVNTIYMLGLDMMQESGAVIELFEVWNDGINTGSTVSECWARTLVIKTWSSDAEFVLPGGITPRSTAADILSVYGNPNGNSHFSSGSNSYNSFMYYYQNDSGLSYEFQFNEDGSLSEVRVIVTPSTIENAGYSQ